jgi:hypothetical protein
MRVTKQTELVPLVIAHCVSAGAVVTLLAMGSSLGLQLSRVVIGGPQNLPIQIALALADHGIVVVAVSLAAFNVAPGVLVLTTAERTLVRTIAIVSVATEFVMASIVFAVVVYAVLSVKH